MRKVFNPWLMASCDHRRYFSISFRFLIYRGAGSCYLRLLDLVPRSNSVFDYKSRTFLDTHTTNGGPQHSPTFRLEFPPIAAHCTRFIQFLDATRLHIVSCQSDKGHWFLASSSQPLSLALCREINFQERSRKIAKTSDPYGQCIAIPSTDRQQHRYWIAPFVTPNHKSHANSFQLSRSLRFLSLS